MPWDFPVSLDSLIPAPFSPTTPCEVNPLSRPLRSKNAFTEPPDELLPKVLWYLGRLPGIGPKSAERMLHFLMEAPTSEVLGLAESLRDLKERIHRCRQCCAPTEDPVCSRCLDTKRDPALICVVEHPRDVALIDRAGRFRGQYHVLYGRISPLDGISPEQLTIDHLIDRVRQGTVKEVILATNPTLEGDGTALYLSSVLGNFDIKITRLARGLPTGSSLEFANSQMLADALDGRHPF